MFRSTFRAQGKYFVATVTACSILFFSLVGGFVYLQLHAQRQAAVEELNTRLSSQVSIAMRLWLEDKIQLAQSFAQAPVIRDLCSDPNNLATRARAEKFLRQSHQRHLPNFTLLAVMYFSPTPEVLFEIVTDEGTTKKVKYGGSILDSIGGRSIGVGDTTFSYVRAVAEGTNAFISEAKPNAVPGLPPLFMVAVPIYDNMGMLRGTFGFGVKLDAFAQHFVTNFQVGETGRIEIIDNRGLYVGHSNPDKILTDSVLPETKAILPHLNMAASTTFSGMLGNQSHEYSASPVVTPYTGASQWWVLFHRSSTETHAEVRLSIFALAGLCLLGVFAMITIALRARAIAQKNAACLDEDL